ncbi:MAG TPA: CAP domain-containing protein, partial [Candidatus Dormibacteraeota bacterium]
MKLLLSRATLVAAMVLMGIVIGRSAPHQQVITAASGPVALPDPGLLADRAVQRQIMAAYHPTPTPTAQPAPPQRVVAHARTITRPPSAPLPAPPPIAGSGAGQFALINQDRAAAGLPPLQWNACLANIAVGQAQRMAAQGYISHANGRALDLGCHLGGPYASESIGVTYGHIDDVGMNTWFMNDPIHRANIMGPYHYVGACWVAGANNR